MANPNDGPQPVDINALFQQAKAGGGGGGGGSGGGGEDNNPVSEALRKLLNKFTGVKLDSTLNTGIFKQFDSKGYTEGQINKGAAAFNLKGGAAGEFFAKSIQIQSMNDFSKIMKPEVKDYPVLPFEHMSFASLGGLSAPTFDGGGGRGGVGGGLGDMG